MLSDDGSNNVTYWIVQRTEMHWTIWTICLRLSLESLKYFFIEIMWECLCTGTRGESSFGKQACPCKQKLKICVASYQLWSAISSSVRFATTYVTFLRLYFMLELLYIIRSLQYPRSMLNSCLFFPVNQVLCSLGETFKQLLLMFFCFVMDNSGSGIFFKKRLLEVCGLIYILLVTFWRLSDKQWMLNCFGSPWFIIFPLCWNMPIIYSLTEIISECVYLTVLAFVVCLSAYHTLGCQLIQTQSVLCPTPRCRNIFARLHLARMSMPNIWQQQIWRVEAL